MMPTVLTHPLAPTAQAEPAVTPKYLVRSDGMVTVYTPVLAKLPNFTPVETLPAAHVLASELAAQRDALAREARGAHQARMEAAELALREQMEAAVTQVGGVSVVTKAVAPAHGEVAEQGAASATHAAAVGTAVASEPATAPTEVKAQAPAPAQPQGTAASRAPTPAAAPVKTAAASAANAAPTVPVPSTAQEIGAADKAGLKEYFAQQGVKADLRRPVEELRALAHEVARKGRAGSA